MYSSFLDKLLILASRLCRHDFAYPYTELEQTQWLSPRDIEKIQSKMLRALVKHAYMNVPYYRRKLKQMRLKPSNVKGIQDIQKLPTLTKNDIRKNSGELISQNIPEHKRILCWTSGSTGEPLRFFTNTRSKNWGNGARFRAYRWYDISIGQKTVEIRGTPPGSPEQSLSQTFKNLFLRKIMLNSYDMSCETMKSFLKKLNKFKPKAIIAYASSAYLLAKYIQKNEVDVARPKVIVTTAEKLHHFQKETIEDTFRCNVFDFYGSREFLSMASECPEGHGYHISAENVILEVVRDNAHISPNQAGKLLVTDLHNYVMPFIRYENGDIAIKGENRCVCERGLPLLKSIEGRTSDVISLSNGRFITSPAFTHVFKNLPVEWYQIIQKTKSKFLIKVLKGDEFSTEHTGHIIMKLRKFLGDVQIEFVYVKRLPLSQSGKWRIVRSEVSLDFN